MRSKEDRQRTTKEYKEEQAKQNKPYSALSGNKETSKEHVERTTIRGG